MLEIRNLTKVYTPRKGQPVTALDKVSLKFEETGMVFVLGKSGSGKSTLLNLLGGLDSYTEGEIIIKGKSSKDFSQGDFDSYRNTYLGFIFQEYNILNEFTVGQNVALALELQGKKNDKPAVDAILKEVDLEGFANRKPHELSGGQKQRVAIARALVKSPEIIMADEPTGALDSNTGKQVFDTLQKLSKDRLVIIVSHDREYAEYYGDRVIEFRDGKVISDIKKYQVGAKSLAGGEINITNDNQIIQIKQGHKLSPQEKEQIIRLIDQPDKDVIVSTDDRGNTEFKKNTRIDAQGNRDVFEDTTEDKMTLKKYSESDFKLRKSRLPSRRAMRIGGSSLKSKPIRLIFTVVLCAVAFALFGLMDTMASYNKVTATYNSFRESDIKTVGLSKQVTIEEGEGLRSRKYTNNVNMSVQEYEDLEEKFKDIEFLPLYSQSDLDFSYNIQDDVNKPLKKFNGRNDGHSVSGSGYHVVEFNGVVSSDANRLEAMGLAVDGTYPANETEIAISKHAAETFIDGKGYYPYTGSGENVVISDASDMIGKDLYIKGKDYTITAIIDTNFDFSRYESLKGNEINQDNVFGSYFLSQEFAAISIYGYHNSMFVCDDYLEDYSLTTFTNTRDAMGGGVFAGYADIGLGSDDFQPSSSSHAVVAKYESTFSSQVKFFDTAKNSVEEGEIVLPMDDVFTIYGNNFVAEGIDILNSDAELKSTCTQLIYDAVNSEGHGITMEEAGEVAASYNGLSDIISGDGFSWWSDNWGNNSYYVDDTLRMEPAGEIVYRVFSAEDGLDKDISVFLEKQRYGGDINYQYEHLSFTLVGVYAGAVSVSSSNYNHAMMLSDADTAKWFPFTDGSIMAALAGIPQDRNAVLDLIEFSYDNGSGTRYKIYSAVSEAIEDVNSMIEGMAKVFLYVGIGFAVFAALMLFNFISVSIVYKKKEIGILRAIGARSSDVFRIFFWESFFITVINSIIAVGFVIGGLIGINAGIRGQGILITFLNFGPRQLLLIAAVGLVTAFISTLLPVWRIARKKPVDAIKK